MKQLLAVTVMAFLLCLAGLVMSGTAFAQRCVDNGETVTDTVTRLMWQKEKVAAVMDWDDAMSYASCLSLDGHSGWRLPTNDELM